MYKTKNFSVKELVHPRIINAIGEHMAWRMLDTGCLMDLDFIRDLWGYPIYINQGLHDSRGLRPPNDGDGAFYSIHKQGKAFDLVPHNGDVLRLWEFIYALIQDDKLCRFNTMESLAFTPTWVHAACTNTGEKPLVINP